MAYSKPQTASCSKDLPSDSFLRRQMNDHDLRRFIDDKLQPDEHFTRECKRKVKELAEFLKTRTKYSVSEVLKSGSLKKGTAIKGKTDLDVVVFLNDFHDMSDYREKLPRVLKELEKAIKDFDLQADIKYRTPYSLKIDLRTCVCDESLGVDILPAFNNIKSAGGQFAVYEEMDKETRDHREFYSSSLSLLQLDFIRQKIGDKPNVKNLIRLVKHWRLTHLLNTESTARRLPTSYVLELLTISRWEQIESPESFSVKSLFKDIMMQLANFGNINVAWDDYHDRRHFRNARQQQLGKPFILDPANPFNNVCERFKWEDVAQMARLSLASPLLVDVR